MTVTEGSTVRDFVLGLLSADGDWPATRGADLRRAELDVLLEDDVRSALVRLNPDIAEEPSRADEVLYRLRGITLSARSTGLVPANEEFRTWLLGEKAMPYGQEHQHVPVMLIDFDNLSRNTYRVATEVTFRHGRATRRFELVLYVNGVPLVVGVATTPPRPAVTWADGAFRVQEDERDVAAFFVPNVFSFATDGRELRFGSVLMPLNLWSTWRDGERAEPPGQPLVEQGVRDLLAPRTVLDVLHDFTVFATDDQHRKIKIICRYQQYEAVNSVVERVRDGVVRKGLLWHFQGSGKSLLMVFAAQKLRRHPRLGSPTVLIVVDRVDLDTQITSTFNAADIPNLVSAESGDELIELLRTEQRKIIITTIQKFRDARAEVSVRQNIICLVDEAHRTQEGDLGQRMRDALPNAFLFGLTGTPINDRERNTFRTFGADEDPGRYLSRYTQADSLRDGTTLPLHFEPRSTELRIDQTVLDAEFNRLTDDLSEEEREAVTGRAGRMATLIKSKQRIKRVCADIARHYTEKVEPNGFKAQVVTFDKESCARYKDELDTLLGPDVSAVVISTGSGTPKWLNERFARSKDAEESLLNRFRDPDDPLKILIVTGRLLTGFDAPILQAMYLDKVIKNHNLLQAVCRTNRPFEHGGRTKTHGLVVDYLGTFEHLAKALQFDEQAMQQVVTNISRLADEVPAAMAKCLAFFPASLDRSLDGHEGLINAQQHLPDDATRDRFAAAYRKLADLWEALSPDPVLTEYRADYVWLTQVYRSVQPGGSTGRLLWRMLGAKTMEIINANLYVDVHADDLDSLVLDAEVVEALEQTPEISSRRVAGQLVERLRPHRDDPRFVSLAERLEQLSHQHQLGQLISLLYLKALLGLARDLVALELETAEVDETGVAGGRAALTALFQQTRNGNTAVAVERIVSDIDDIVQKIRFPGWQHTIGGAREVKQALRRTLLKYKLHRDEDLFTKAYDYIRQYY